MVLEAGMRLSVPAAVTSDCKGPEQRCWPRADTRDGRHGTLGAECRSRSAPESVRAGSGCLTLRRHWTLCMRKFVDAVLLCTLFQRINKTCSGCLLKIFKGRMGQGIRLLLMLQCYKFSGKTDSLPSWCKYSFPLKNKTKHLMKIKRYNPSCYIVCSAKMCIPLQDLEVGSVKHFLRLSP